jgi:hypothetical protein
MLVQPNEGANVRAVLVELREPPVGVGVFSDAIKRQSMCSSSCAFWTVAPSWKDSSSTVRFATIQTTEVFIT